MKSAPTTKFDTTGRTWAAVALLTLVALVAYANSFRVPLLLDDWITIQENPQLRHRRSLAAILSPPEHTGLGGRPVANLSFILNYALTGDAVGGFHAVNLVIHLATGLALYGLIHRTLRRRGDGDSRKTWVFALGAAALWMIHPLATQSVTYISQRTESLMGFWYLAMLYCLVGSATSPRAGWWQAGGVACCAFGMATKEGMVTAPLVAFLYDRCFIGGSWRNPWRERRGFYVALAATWLLLPFLMGGLHARGVGFTSTVNWWDYALIECGAIFRYFWLAIWPARLVFDYGFDVAPAIPAAYFAAALLVGLAVGAVVGVVRGTAWGFLAAWWLLMLAPTSSVVPIPLAPISENRAYLAYAAVTVGVVGLVARCRGNILPSFAVAATVPLIALTSARNADYRSEISIWTDTVAKNPDSARAHNNLGRALQQAGRTLEAKREFEAAIRIKFDYGLAHANLASAFGTLGQHEAAFEEARQAIAADPTSAEAHYNLGIALTRLGRLPEAAIAVADALRRRPGFVEAHTALASVLLQLNRPAEALREAQASLAIKPEAGDARYLLGAALMQLGRLPEAIATFEAAMRNDPNNIEARYALGTALLQAGRPADAIAPLQATLRANPNHVNAHSNLGMALWETGKVPEAAAEFEAALRIDPSAPAPRENLQRLRAQAP